jgi:hypothetical protein
MIGMPNYVYLLRCHEYYKIGYTDDVQARIRSLQTGNPYPLVLHRCYAFEFKGVILIEQHLHAKFRTKRGVGEWFKLSIKQIAQFDEICDSFGGISYTIGIDAQEEKRKLLPTAKPRKPSKARTQRIKRIRSICEDETIPIERLSTEKFDFRQMIRDGWRIEFRQHKKYWFWRRGKENKESLYGGPIDELPEEFH